MALFDRLLDSLVGAVAAPLFTPDRAPSRRRRRTRPENDVRMMDEIAAQAAETDPDPRTARPAEHKSSHKGRKSRRKGH